MITMLVNKRKKTQNSNHLCVKSIADVSTEEKNSDHLKSLD